VQILRAATPQFRALLIVYALTGHTSDQNLELYLRGVDHYPLARAAQEALEEQFGDLLAEAQDGANARKFAGTTGWAARKGRGDCQQAANKHCPHRQETKGMRKTAVKSGT
jgi:hypothetical protein